MCREVLGRQNPQAIRIDHTGEKRLDSSPMPFALLVLASLILETASCSFYGDEVGASFTLSKSAEPGAAIDSPVPAISSILIEVIVMSRAIVRRAVQTNPSGLVSKTIESADESCRRRQYRIVVALYATVTDVVVPRRRFSR